MATLFSRIIDGELPGHFVWWDSTCVVFLSIQPQTRGHALVVPRAEIDHWIDVPDDILDHVMHVAREVGAAQLAAFGGTRAGVVIQGYGVPHMHVHVFPTTGPEDFRDLDGGAMASDDDLATAARALRSALLERGNHRMVEASIVASAR